MEIWRPIKGYQGLYEVSNRGRVRSLPRTTLTRAGYTNTFPGKEIKPGGKRRSGRGYLNVTLCKFGIRQSFEIHRLVAEAFVPNPDNKPGVNHKDGNKNNNRKSNLEWATKDEQHDHAVRMEFHCKKLTRKQVAYVCRELNKGTKGTELAAKLKVTSGAIYNIRRTFLRGWQLHEDFG